VRGDERKPEERNGTVDFKFPEYKPSSSFTATSALLLSLPGNENKSYMMRERKKRNVER